MRRLLVVVVAGCGHYGFSRAPDDDLGPPKACVPTPEICNGIDDSCDGQIDEGCPCTVFDTTVPSVRHDKPGLAWTGTAYAVMRGDATNLMIGIIDAVGTVGPTAIVASLANNYVPSGRDTLAWTGNQLVAITSDRNNGGVTLSRFDGLLAPISPPLVIAEATGSAHIVWAGDRLALAYQTVDALKLAEIAPDGSTILPAIPLDVPLVYGLMSLDETVDSYTLGVMLASGEAAIVLVDRHTGTVTTTPLQLGTGGSHLRAIPGPGGAAAAWTLGSTGTPFQTIDSVGSLASSPTMVPSYGGGITSSVDLVAMPAAYRVIGNTTSQPRDIFYAEIDPTGTVTTPATQIGTFDAFEFGGVSAIAVAGRFALAQPYSPTPLTYLTRVIQQCL